MNIEIEIHDVVEVAAFPRVTYRVTLADIPAWNAFVVANDEALREAYGDSETAYQHACQGGLTLGGEAAPLVIISFEE